MKKIIIAASLLMVGCAKEEIKQEPIKDCNCDRIVRVLPGFDIIVPGQPIKHSGGAITINDCSGEQRKFGNGNGTYEFSQKVGECYNW
jgi:hypothetical protein